MPVKELIQYPPDFPPESRSRVAAERVRAGKDFDEARENLPRMEHGGRSNLEAELRRYTLRQFAVFVSEARELGCQGIWQIDRVEQEALEFLRRSTIAATFSKGFDEAGRKFGRDWSDNWGYIQPRVMREFERSGEWRQFQEALLQVAERQSMRASEAGEKVREEIGDITRDSAQSERTGQWLEVEEVAMPAPELPAATAAAESNRRTAVDAFLVECNKESAAGSKVVKKHLWLVAGHRHPRQFQYWQSGSEEATEEDERNFRRIISMPPAEFLALLKKKSISTSNS